ncbi:FadR/GntR family transcriptional regulator [Halodurantibacterium flavum]|uniref:FadR/GntR family transcriptional regulator n=1 Tax=Halodurantibacterium flavum TaxID=1382802 RepID=A0ABW4S0X1_9RHOB
MIPETLSSENASTALESLRAMLRSGRFPEGSRLPTERVLCDQLGMSRRAVRRALEVLEAEGRIWRRQGSGTYVGQAPDGLQDHVDMLVNGTDFMEIMEVRLQIEPQLARLAALRARPAEVLRMQELAQKLQDSTDADSRELWDGALHRQIARAAGNRLFLALFDIVNRVRQDEAWQTLRERARSSAGSVSVSHDQHSAIVTAIADHDPARAGEAMRQHLMMLRTILYDQTLGETLAPVDLTPQPDTRTTPNQTPDQTGQKLDDFQEPQPTG